MSATPDPLPLSLCPTCAGVPAEVGTCATCGGAGLFDAQGEPWQPVGPWASWTPAALVRLSRQRSPDLADARDLLRADHDTGGTMPRPRQQPAADEPARRRPLSLSDILERLLDKAPADHSTVKLARNARGATQVEVSVRTGEAGLETPADALAEARRLYDELTAAYPMPADDAEGGGRRG